MKTAVYLHVSAAANATPVATAEPMVPRSAIRIRASHVSMQKNVMLMSTEKKWESRISRTENAR